MGRPAGATWRAIAAVASLCSLLLLGAFGNVRLLLGVAIDVDGRTGGA